MARYWITFRIEDDSTGDRRRQDLYDAIEQIAASHLTWSEPTSFILFESNHDINGVAAAVKSVIDEDVDIALVGMPEVKSARIIGASIDPDLFKFMPFTRRA